MSYFLLACSIALEITATTLLKYSEGFSRPIPSVCSILLYTVCFFIFSKVLTSIHLGVAYATWSVGGIVITSILGVVLFGQRLNTVGIIAMGLIIVGCVLLNLFGTVN